jgi:hypothetical protein
VPVYVALVALLAIGRLLGLSGYVVDVLVAFLFVAAVVVPVTYVVIFVRGVRSGWNAGDDDQ